MADDKATWRKFFDMMEGSVRGPAEKWANSEAFSAMLMNVSSNWHSLNESTRENLTKVMHAANISSHSDITKLMRQVGALTGKIDSLAARLETIEALLTPPVEDKRDGPTECKSRSGKARP